MKKRIEIQQDLKRGFGSAPTGIKNLVKWSLVGFVVYVAVRFVCAFLGGVATSGRCGDLFGRCAAHVDSFGGGGFPHPCRVAHPLRARHFHPCALRDTLKRNINH